MEIRELDYMRRVNLGNYEHEELTAKAVLAEGECHRTATKELKKAVLVALGLEKEEVVKADKKVEEKPAKKKTTKKAAPAKKAAPKKEEPKKVPAKKAAPKKSANIKYDREIDEHKEELGSLFDEFVGDWKAEKATLKVCAGISREVVDMDFMDSDGNVLASFKEFVSGRLEDEGL